MSKLNENQKFLLGQMVKDEKKQNKLLYTSHIDMESSIIIEDLL